MFFGGGRGSTQDWVKHSSLAILAPNKVMYKWMVIGADCHNVEGNEGEVGANLHTTAQLIFSWAN